VKLLERLAEERVSETIADAKMKIALEVERTSKQLMMEKVHDKLSHLAAAHRRDGSGSAGALPAQSAPGRRSIPGDLLFTNLAAFQKEYMDKVVKDLRPRPKYTGPLDMEEEITKLAKRLGDEWKARGSPAKEKPHYILSYWEKHPPWPFQKIRDGLNRETGVIAVSAPFTDDYYQGELERGTFWQLKNEGHIMLGISSYEHFPGEIINPSDNRHVRKNPDDWNVYMAMDGWLHCMRNPDAFLPPGIPRALISESDFTNPMRKDGGGVLIPQGYEKQYDFIYINQGGGWNDYNRNFTLARECLKLMAEWGYKIVVLSRDVSKDPMLAPYVAKGQIVVHKSELWRDFLKLLETVRTLFTPNIADASPRVAAESMSLNVSLLMNYNIVGGWKYVTDKTGVYFTGTGDLKAAIDKLRSPEFQAGLNPRQWFMDNWGTLNAGLRLRAFLELTVGKERMQEAFKMRASKGNRRRLLRR